MSVGKLAWVYSAGSLGNVAGGCAVEVCGIVGIIVGAGLWLVVASCGWPATLECEVRWLLARPLGVPMAKLAWGSAARGPLVSILAG